MDNVKVKMLQHAKSAPLKALIVLGLIVSAETLYAWSAPPAGTPPNCPSGQPGCDAPINVSNTLQSKDGNLILNAAGTFATGLSVPFGNVGIGSPSPAQKLDVNGAVQATAFYYSSDESLKTNIETIPNALGDILKLRGVNFNWKKDGTASVGVIAQEIEKVYPELVSTNPTTGLKSVEYANLVGPLIEAVKELKQENNELRARIEKLEAKN